MNKGQLILDIQLEIKTLQSHLKRIEKPDYTLHALDVDMLKDKVRMIYERVFELESLVQNIPVPEITKEENKPGTSLPEDNKPAPAPPSEPVKEAEQKEEIIENEEEEQVENETVVEQELFAREPETEETPLPPEPPKKPTYKKPTIEPEQKEEVIKTTLDLFSDMPGESLGETIAPADEPTVAERLQKSQISDLRKAIGINEKFQFINELFNGDLGKYNKAIDELNSFSSLDGAKTYLFELHVEYQWADDNPALLKLNELLERKFA